MKAFTLTLVLTVIYYVSSNLIYEHLCIKQNGEFLRHPLDCHKFIRCSHGKAYEFQCPANLLWHHEIKTCDYAYRTRCSNGEMFTKKTSNNDLSLENKFKKTRKKFKKIGNKNKETFASKRPNKSVTKSNVKNATQIMLTTTDVKLTKAKNESHNFKNMFKRKLTTFSTHSWQPQQLITKSLNHNLTAMHNVKTTEQLKEMLTVSTEKESLTTKSSKSETTSITVPDTNLTVNSTVKITELEQETSEFININAVTEEMSTKEIKTDNMLTESAFKENQYTKKAFIEYISNYLHRASTSVMPTVTTQLENGQIKSSTENSKDENNAKQNYSLNSHNITELPNYQSTSMAKASDATITVENVTVNYNFNKSTEKLTKDLENGVTTGNLEKTKDKLKTTVANLYQTTKSFNSLETTIQPFTVNRTEEVHTLLQTLENYILNKNTTTKYSDAISGGLTKNTTTIQESSTIINSSTFKITEAEYNLQNSTDNNSTTILDLDSYSNIKFITESLNNTDSFEKTKTTEYSEDTLTTIAESSAILTEQENNLNKLSKSFTENFKNETTTYNFIYETLMEHFIYETSIESFKDETSTESFKNETSTLTTPTESSTEIEDNIKHNFITFKFVPVATDSYTEIHNSPNNLTENFSVNKTEEAKGIENSPIESSAETPNSLIFKKTNYKQNLSETFKASTESSAIVSETLVLIEKLNSTTILEEAFTKSSVSSFGILDNSNNKQNFKYTPNEVTENENKVVNSTEISIANDTISTKENFNFKVTESINHSLGALENFPKFLSSANNKMTTENFNKMPVSKYSLDNFSESSTEIVEFQSSTGQENKISTESFKDIRGSTVLDNEISTESFKNIPDSTFGLTLAIEDFSESLTVLSETFNSSVIPTGSFENKITNLKMSTLSEKTLPVTASSLSVTAVNSLEPLTVTTETVNNYEILTEMFDIKTTESNQDLEDSSVLHNEISTKTFDDIPIATFSLDVSKVDFLEILTVPRETVKNSETLIENFNDKTTKSSKDSKVPEQNTLHFQGSEAFNDIPDGTLSLSSLAETTTFNLTDKEIKITSSDLENLENHTETSIITYNDSEETEQDLEKTAGYGDTTFVANTITKYPESLNLKEALSEIMLEDSSQTVTDESFSINFLHTIKDSSRKTKEMENIITNNLESNSTYVTESLDYLEHNSPNNANIGSTLQPYVTDENDYKASPTVYAVNITEFDNTTVSDNFVVNFTENVNPVSSSEEFVTKLITTELLQNSSNILYLTENSIGVFNTNISANLREQERDINVTDIKRETTINSSYSVTETLIAGYNENKPPFKLAENSTNTTVIDFRNISTITTTLQDLTTEFNAHSTTPDPRLPFRSPKYKGVNNRRQFKAPKCFQYYQCFAGWAFLLNCHEGWWFEVKESQCVLDVNKKCELY